MTRGDLEEIDGIISAITPRLGLPPFRFLRVNAIAPIYHVGSILIRNAVRINGDARARDNGA